ncbi:hypothetical protein [Spirosoma utsteinense]|uniref:Uncharacterized protein n=1 Tax=Spirosoma utsteinense TaxID=2585773 RepID=A0ABR6W4R7_9BACT|nr:hypothetical protein [Spirosoma utsteinense]MBC3785413.1 hypothetical protein [Spirosoma utsteinense]MBC3791559.1 hypothetical protein [Spirosoma utsteinense]
MRCTLKQTVMKTLLTIGILLVGLSGEALSMGHPHNVFAARKQMRAKTLGSIAKSNPSACPSWQPVVHINKHAFSKRLLAALSRMQPSQAY